MGLRQEAERVSYFLHFGAFKLECIQMLPSAFKNFFIAQFLLETILSSCGAMISLCLAILYRKHYTFFGFFP